jgi:hypothetical protein
MGLPWSPPRVLGQTGLCLSPWCAWGGTAGARAAGPSPFRVAVTLPGSTGPVGSRPNREGPCCEQREPHAHRRGDHLASDPLTEVPMDPTNGIGRRATAAVTSALAAATVLAALVVAAPTPAGAAPQQPADPAGAFLLRGGRFTPLGASPAPRWRRRSTSTTAARCRRLPRRPGRRPLLCQGPAGPGDHLRGPRRRRHPCPGASTTAARSPAPGTTVPGPGPPSSRARGTACVGPRPPDPLRRPPGRWPPARSASTTTGRSPAPTTTPPAATTGSCCGGAATPPSTPPAGRSRRLGINDRGQVVIPELGTGLTPITNP